MKLQVGHKTTANFTRQLKIHFINELFKHLHIEHHPCCITMKYNAMFPFCSCRVTEYQHKNMMNPENLAIVFAPTLLRSPENDPLLSLTAVKFERELIELFIMYYKLLFET